MFFFFKQKTAYEMRISDWSSDVCSSDLSKGDLGVLPTRTGLCPLLSPSSTVPNLTSSILDKKTSNSFYLWSGPWPSRSCMMRTGHEIGRASCRERVCQYV